MAGFDFFVRFRSDDKVTAALVKLQTKIESVQKATEKAAKSTSKFSHKFSTEIDAINGKLRQQAQDIAGTAASMVALGMAIAKPINDAIAFETAMAEVNKAVGGTPQQLKKMEKEILNMSKTIPILPEELAKIVAAGGRLGIPADKLTGFAETTAKAAVAFDMTAEQAGDAFASLSNKMNIPLTKIGEVGDAINYLADTTASQAPNIIEIMGRISGTMKQLSIPPHLAAGIAAFADQVFVSEELAASGVEQFVSALARTNKKFGLFTKLQKEGASGFRDILGSLQKMDITKLTEMFGVESARAIATMSGNLNVYDKTLGSVADKTKFAGSMQAEFERQSKTTANQIQLMKNALNRMFVAVGSAFLPAINGVIKAVEPLLNKITAWAENNQDVVRTLIKIAAGIAIVVAGALIFKVMAFSIIAVLGTLKMVVAAATVAFRIMSFVLSMNPIGLVITAIATLIYYMGGFDSIISAVKGTMKDWFNWLASKLPLLNDIIDALKDVGSAIGFGEETKITQEATIKTMAKPLDNTVKSQSNVNVNIQAKGASVTSVEQSTQGAGLNVGVNALGGR